MAMEREWPQGPNILPQNNDEVKSMTGTTENAWGDYVAYRVNNILSGHVHYFVLFQHSFPNKSAISLQVSDATTNVAKCQPEKG